MTENGISDTAPSIAEQWEAKKAERVQPAKTVAQSWAEKSAQGSALERLSDHDNVQCTLGELKEFMEFRGAENGYSRWEKFQQMGLSFDDVAERFAEHKKQEGVLPERAPKRLPSWAR